MRLLAPLFLIGLLSTSPGSAAEPTGESFRENALVRRVQWPVRFVPRIPGGCDGFRPEDVDLREDGMLVLPESIERTALATLHAVLLDASTSMRSRLRDAKKAAGEYIRSLDAEEPVMLASFSDNLILHTPATRDRFRLLAALEQVEVRSGTALNDALYYMIGYLSSRPERKVLVLLTDGCDSSSLPQHPIRNVIDHASQVENLTVFPIGVDLPGSCEGFPFGRRAWEGPVDVLERLARRSGGQLYRAREARGVSGIFSAIRERLAQEGFVTYRPVPFGNGPKDRPDRSDQRDRRVSVRSTKDDRCRVVSAGPEIRRETRGGGESDRPLDSPDPLRPPFGTPLALRDWWQPSEESEAPYLQLEPERILGRAADILRERALLYSASSYHRRGKYRRVVYALPEIGRRDFEVRVLPFALAREQIDSPGALLFHLLKTGSGPFDSPEQPLSPSWVHGQTWLELRAALGQALFGYSGYREFAERRLGDACHDEIRRIVDHAPALRDLLAEQGRSLEESIDELLPAPRASDLQRYLADWLGDISARDLVTSFERWVANRILDGGLASDSSGDMLRMVETRWSELATWFPPPTRVRIITPLVPVFDAARDRIGFFRIVLPRAGPRGPVDAVPPAPLGLRFVLRVAEHSASALAGKVEVRSIAYDELQVASRKNLVRAAKQRDLIAPGGSWSSVPVVHVRLGSSGFGSDELACTALFTGDPAQPVCADCLGAAFPTSLPTCSPP